jgi:hypothetical protein
MGERRGWEWVIMLVMVILVAMVVGFGDDND